MPDKLCSEVGCERKARLRGMCHKHYDKAIHSKTIPVVQPKGLTVSHRLEKSSIRNERTGCFEWVGSKDEKGYGLIGINGKTKKVHRVAWEIANGPIPDGLQVLHKCDNRACGNEDHLFLGTHQDNMNDMNAKGRRMSLKGEDHGCAKLSEDQVREIRDDHRSHREIAKDFQVAYSLIGMIKRGKIWRHVI